MVLTVGVVEVIREREENGKKHVGRHAERELPERVPPPSPGATRLTTRPR